MGKTLLYASFLARWLTGDHTTGYPYICAHGRRLCNDAKFMRMSGSVMIP
jgi:hypothetical protein